MLTKQVISLSQLVGRETQHRKNVPDDLFSTTFNISPRLHECYWRDGEQFGSSQPSVVIPFDGDAETFYADVATYYPEMSPISAYTNVLSQDFIKLARLSDLTATKSINPTGPVCLDHRIWVAMSIAEAATNLFNSSTGIEEGVSFSICRRSLSFSIARASVLYPNYPSKKIVERWLQLRELSKMEYSPVISATILWISSVAFDSQYPEADSRGEPLEFVVLIRKMVERSLSFSQFTKYLADTYPDISEYLHILGGDYDGRMQGLTQIINAVRMHKRGVDLDAMAIAYFCNEILPGSLAHMRLLARYVDEYPSILIWYGFFSGLSEDFDWRDVMSGIGQKLLRDMRSPFSFENSPCADIALEELAVLARIGITSSVIKPIQQRAMLVSLLPGIDIYCRLPIDGSVESSVHAVRSSGQDREISARDRQLQYLLAQAQALLGKDEIYRVRSQESQPEKKAPRKRARTSKPDGRY